jgi:hypothetical protein
VTTIAIEVNDAGITVAAPDRVLAVEPGYALVEKDGIVTGAAAYAQARLRPRNVSNRYWAELSLESGTGGIPGIRNSAELAFAQLARIWEQFKSAASDVVLVVPGNYDKTRLGLLLGLTQECGMPVRAMVDVAAAASTRPYPGRQLLYVNAGLHRFVVTPLRQENNEATALEEKTLAKTGIAELNDLFAKRIRDMFVLATRFDPFHRADSEQALYDRLPQWLEQLRDAASIEALLPVDGEEFRVTVERSRLLGVAVGPYKALVQLIAQAREPRAALAVQVSDRLARQPGLAAELARLDDTVVIVHEVGHAARAVLAAVDKLPAGGQVKLLRRLAWREAPAEAVTPASTVASPVPAPERETVKTTRPTHVVYRGIAYRINGEGLLIGRAHVDDRQVLVIDDQSSGVSRSHCEIALADGELVVRDLSSYGTFVNEKRISGQEILRPADVIRIGSPGAELQLVRVET